jgi:DNA-binding response OmpR family regulator
MLHRNFTDRAPETRVKDSGIPLFMEKQDNSENASRAVPLDVRAVPSAFLPGESTSKSAAHPSAKSRDATPEEPLLIALIDNDDAQRHALRQRLDAVGYASLAFDSPEDLYAAMQADRLCGYTMVVLLGEGLGGHLGDILSASRSPLLLVARKDNPGVLSDNEKLFRCSGTVDALMWPCSDRELAWRLQFLTQRKARPRIDDDMLAWGPYGFELRRRVVRVDGRRVSLKPREFELALELFRNLNSIVTRESLYAALWEEPHGSPGSRKLDVCVCSIRAKLGLGPDRAFVLRTHYGRGYELAAMTPRRRGNAQAHSETLAARTPNENQIGSPVPEPRA